MNTSSRQHGALAPAYSLIEVVTVMAIIVILAGTVVGTMGYYKYKANEGRTKVLIASIERALEEYKSDNGSYPAGTSTTAVYTALYGGGKVYLSTLNPNLTGKALNVKASGGSYVIIDGWGNNMGYTSPGVMNPANDFDLWSNGGDGTNGTTDDIKNW